MRKIRTQRKSLLLVLVIGIIAAVVFGGGWFQRNTHAQSNNTEVTTGVQLSSAFKAANLLGRMSCATTARADKTIILSGVPHAGDGLAVSQGSTYDHGLACPDQFIVEVHNLPNLGNYWILGGDVGPPPDNEIKCNAMRIEVATYGFVPSWGWTNHFNYVLTGQWKTSPYPTCDYAATYEPGTIPLAKPYYSKVRSAVKVTTFLGLKQRAMAGIL
ncbi:MAG TPA: hypothetical protein VEW46_23200 [Pyrinomonadaceae bacterium]|nr:hypothetical protein [Pyrinomonadaceae bacterium]